MTLAEAYDATRILENALRIRFDRGHPEDFWRVLRIERVQAWDVAQWSGVGETWGLLLCNAETKQYARSSNFGDFQHWPPRLIPETSQGRPPWTGGF